MAWCRKSMAWHKIARSGMAWHCIAWNGSGKWHGKGYFKMDNSKKRD